MDVTVSLVLKAALAIFVTMMALVSLVFFIVVISAVIGDKKERKLQKQKDADIPCLKCQYFDSESHACLKEDKYANSSHA